MLILIKQVIFRMLERNVEKKVGDRVGSNQQALGQKPSGLPLNHN